MYELIFDDKALEFLTKLPKELRKRISVKIWSAKENPFHYFEKLTKRGDYKLRVGNYRVIADIDTTAKKIRITSAGHRKNIYQN